MGAFRIANFLLAHEAQTPGSMKKSPEKRKSEALSTLLVTGVLCSLPGSQKKRLAIKQIEAQRLGRAGSRKTRVGMGSRGDPGSGSRVLGSTLRPAT